MKSILHIITNSSEELSSCPSRFHWAGSDEGSLLASLASCSWQFPRRSDIGKSNPQFRPICQQLSYQFSIFEQMVTVYMIDKTEGSVFLLSAQTSANLELCIWNSISISSRLVSE